MPYPNEHAARVHDPGGYTSFARKQLAPGIWAIFGVKSGRSEIQAYRFDREKFTVKAARAWLIAHNVKVILFEPASKEMTEAIRSKVK